MGVMSAPIMGPVIGGWLTESYNWRWVFYVNVPLGATTLAILWHLLPLRPTVRCSFDLLGFTLIGTAMASFQLMIDRGQQLDWYESSELMQGLGMGMGMVFMPLNNLAFVTLLPGQRTDGASLLNLMRSIDQSGGISVATALLARNIQVSHADLAQHLTPDRLMLPGDAATIAATGPIGQSTVAMVDATINQQAAMVAYLDDFYLMGWIALCVTPFVAMLSNRKGRLEPMSSQSGK